MPTVVGFFCVSLGLSVACVCVAVRRVLLFLCVVPSKPFVLFVCAVYLRCFLRLELGLLEVCAVSREASRCVLVGVLVVERCSRGLSCRLAVVLEGVFVASWRVSSVDVRSSAMKSL